MTLKVEHFDKLTGIASWSGPLADRPANGGTAGSKFFCTDVGGRVDIWDGSAWTTIQSGGAAHVTLYDANGDPITSLGQTILGADVSSRTLTIDGAGDVIDDPTAPLAAEIITVTLSGTQQHVWVGYISDAITAPPYSIEIGCAINAADINAAITALTKANIGAGGTSTVDEGCLTFGLGVPPLAFNVGVDENGDPTTDYINTLHFGAYVNTGGSGVVKLVVRVW